MSCFWPRLACLGHAVEEHREGLRRAPEEGRGPRASCTGAPTSLSYQTRMGDRPRSAGNF